MSEAIVHTAIYDDTARLVAAAGERLPAIFAEVLAAHHDRARLGAVTRHADRHAVGLLQRYRQAWRDDSLDGRTRAKLAFVLGWLSHRAADRQFKPVFRETCPPPRLSPSDCSIYHDACVLRRRYLPHGAGPFDLPTFLHQAGCPEGEAVSGLRSLIMSLLQGTLIALHTFIPDDDDPDGWLDRLDARFQTLRIDMDRYLAAIVHPDPDCEQRFLADIGFYAPDDPLIRLVEGLQAGTNADLAAITAATQASQRSHYGQALATAWSYLCAAGNYFTGALDEHGLAEALDHGKPGRDGIAV